MIRKVTIFLLIVSCNHAYCQSRGTIEYMMVKKEIPNIKFQLPNVTKWNLVMDAPRESGNKGVVMFKHKPIEVQCSDCMVEPIIAILYETIPDSTDLVEYSVGNIGIKPYQLSYNLLGGYPDHSTDDNSIVFDAKYVREEVEHTVILAYIIHNNIGIEIICDSVTEAFPQVEQQMRDFIKNLNTN